MNRKAKILLCIAVLAVITAVVVLSFTTKISVSGALTKDNNSASQTMVAPKMPANKPKEAGLNAALAIVGLLAVAFLVLRQRK